MWAQFPKNLLLRKHTQMYQISCILKGHPKHTTTHFYKALLSFQIAAINRCDFPIWAKKIFEGHDKLRYII